MCVPCVSRLPPSLFTSNRLFTGRLDTRRGLSSRVGLARARQSGELSASHRIVSMLSFFTVSSPGAAAAEASKAHVTGAFTNRGLDYYAQNVHHAMPLEDLLKMALGPPSEGGQGKFVLELGCGEAHALLDLQQMYPAMTAHCQNSASYASWCRGFGDGNRTRCGHGPNWRPANGKPHSVETWKATAAFFNINTSLPKWPLVTFTNFGGTKPLPFQSSQYDLVIAQHALDNGKIMSPRGDFPTVFREAVRVLRDDGGILLAQTLSSGVDIDDLVNNTLSAPKHQRQIRARMEAANFPFHGEHVYAETTDPKDNITYVWKEYYPVDFTASNPIGNGTCVDLFSFMKSWGHRPGSGQLYVVARKHLCRLSERKASCTKWEIDMIPQKRSLHSYTDHYVDVVHRMIEGGTKCVGVQNASTPSS